MKAKSLKYEAFEKSCGNVEKPNPRYSAGCTYLQKNTTIVVHIKSTNKIAILNENVEIGERFKGVHFIDLGESFPTS